MSFRKTKYGFWSSVELFFLTQAEGLITGTMVNTFTIVPVIVCGTAASAVYGLVPVLPGYDK